MPAVEEQSMTGVTLPEKSKSLNRWSEMGYLLLLALVFWVARYWFIKSYGLYEDDLTIIPSAVSMTFGNLLNYIFSYIIHLYGHGRPLHPTFIYLFSFLGWRLGGLTGAYVVGYLLTVLNIALFYWLMRRVANLPFALIASLAYCLYSADTTQAYLTLSLGVQPSLTFLLLACHLYLSNRRVWAYLLALIILFSYETPFLLFLAAPLLKKVWDRRLVKEFIIHAAITGGMLLGIYLMRLILKTGQVEDLPLSKMIPMSFQHMWQGPFVSLKTFLTHPYNALQILSHPGRLASQTIIILACLAVFLVLSWVLARLPITTTFDPLQIIRSLRGKDQRVHLPDELKMIWQMSISGAVMLVMAYPLTLSTDPFQNFGRVTRVHTAGVVGAAILFTCGVCLVLYVANFYKLKLPVIVIVAGCFASLTGYGFIIQNDYRIAWQYQQQFWTEILPLIQDASRGTVVIVEPGIFKDVAQIGANSWNVPRVLSQIIRFPDSWGDDAPRIYRLLPGWDNNLVAGEGKIGLDKTTVTAPTSAFGIFDSSNTIFIENSDGKMIRRVKPLILGDVKLSIKPVTAPVLSAYPNGFLYNYLITR